MLRTEMFLILKQIKMKENFAGTAKTMLHKHHKTERKMTAQLLARFLQGLQNTDVGLYNITAQSFCFNKNRQKFGDQASFPGSLLTPVELWKFRPLRNGPSAS